MAKTIFAESAVLGLFNRNINRRNILHNKIDGLDKFWFQI